MSPAAFSACSSPVRTSAVPPSAALIRRFSSAGVVSPSAATTTSVIAPGSRPIFCTSDSGMTSVPIPSEFWSPILAIPLTL